LSYDDHGLKNILGANYFHERNHNIADFTVYNYDVDYDFTIPNTTQESYGIFDQATYEAHQGLRITAGLRYSHDEKNKEGEFISYCPPFTPYNGSYAYNPVCFEKIPDAEQGTWSKVNWKVGAELDVSPTTLGFVNIATGYKAGGLSDANAPGLLPAPYKPEDVTNYELGLKSRLLDSRLQLNVDSFYMEYRNLQVTQVQQPVGQFTTNAAAAEIYGAEFEATWVPTSADRVTGFANYLHATYTQFNHAVDQLTGALVANLSGNWLPNAPSFSARLRYQHDFGLPDGSLLSPGASVYYQEHSFLREFNEPVDRVPAYSKSMVSLRYRGPQRKWSVEAYGDNLENRYIRSAQFVLAGTYLSYYNPPRTYGLRVGLDF
jgi:iron complex outermembrane receptor protein